MNFTNLEYFLAVAECLNISKAAEELYTSQQNLSNHISRLEEELKVSLFERSPIFRLSYAGEWTKKAAKEILALEKNLYKQLDDISNQRKALLRIGTTRTRGRILLSDVLPRFHKLYPEVELNVQLSRHDELVRLLKRGDIDLIVGMKTAPLDADIQTHHIYSDRLCLVVPAHIMRISLPNISPFELEAIKANGLVNICVFRDADFLLHKAGSALNTISMNYFAYHNFTPHISLELNDLEMLHHLCYSGMGIICSFEYFSQKWAQAQNESERAKAYVLPINEEMFKSEFIVAHSTKHYFSRAAKQFIEIAQESFAFASDNDPTDRNTLK